MVINKYLYFFILIFCLISGGCKSNKKAENLSKIYRDKIMAYSGLLSFKMIKLKKRPLTKDTVIAAPEHHKDRVAFLKLMVETNYHNLELRNDYPNDVKNSMHCHIAMIDSNYHYSKKYRLYCDEDIIHLSVEFNKNWPPSRIPTNTQQLYDYLYYKSEMTNYLLQNKCY